MNKMKTTTSIILLVGALCLAEKNSPAQGTLYFSNLGQPFAGSLSVGSDSWWAAGFFAGTNSILGYALNSVQLAITGATGNPAGFKVMIYDSSIFAPTIRSNIANLTGNSNPTANGVYTFTPSTSVTLKLGGLYHIVATVETMIGQGSYGWSFENTPPPVQNGGWNGGAWARSSNDGAHWTASAGNYLQFAINATAIPEPSALALFGLSVALLLTRRRQNWS